MRLNNILEVCILFVFSAIFLFLGTGSLLNHQIVHDSPYGYLASDAFQHQSRTEGIKYMGNYLYEPEYAAASFKDAVGFYPPVFHHIAAIASYAFDIESYDSVYLTITLLTLLGALTLYLIIKSYNKPVTLLSLPFLLFMFAKSPHIGFTFGYWPALAAHSIIIMIIWGMIRIRDTVAKYLFVAISLSLLALTHTSEFIFFFPMILLFAALDFFRSKDKKIIAGNLILGALSFALISVYYLIIFSFTWAKVGGGIQIFRFQELENASLILNTSDFFAFGILVIVGLIYFIISYKNFIKKEHFILFISSLYLSLLCYGNIIGMSHWASQLRYSWPLWLSPFFGMGLYIVMKKVKLNTWIITYSASVILMIMIGAFFVKPYNNQGTMNDERWEVLDWISENTDPSSDLLLFYGDTYGTNAVTRNTKRVHSTINRQEFIDAIGAREVKPQYQIRILGDRGGVNYAYRKGLFDYGYHFHEQGGVGWETQDRSICDYDLILLDRLSMIPQLSQYNLLIAERLISNGYFEQVFSNQMSLVLKNTKKGGCIEKETF